MMSGTISNRKAAKMIAVVGLSVVLDVFLAHIAEARQVHVKGHYRKDGTYVSPHMRNVDGGSSSFYPRTKATRSSPISSFSSLDVSDPRSGSSYSVPTSSSSNYAPSYDNPDYDSIMRSLKNCQALKEDGTHCKKRALPGIRYCSLHVGYTPPVVEVPKSIDTQTLLRDSELRIETLAMVDTLRRTIAQSMSKNGGVPPKNLAEISAVTNDAWGRALYYETDGKDYAIASDGPDGCPSTDDDINFLSNEHPICQAVLPTGKICGMATEAKSWYCSTHAVRPAKKNRPDETSRDAPMEKPSGGGLRILLDMLLLLLATGVVVMSFRWMSKGRPRRGR